MSPGRALGSFLVTALMIGATGLVLVPATANAAPLTLALTTLPPTSATCGNTGVLAPSGTTCTYSVVGTDVFNPPAGMTQVDVTVLGAASGQSSSTVGATPGPDQPGGQTTGTVSLSGPPLQVDVGGIGGSAAPTASGCGMGGGPCGGQGGVGGFGGSNGGIPGAPGDASGGTGGTNTANGGNGAGGGGSSDVRASATGCGSYSCDLTSRVLVAGGGGGKGGNGGSGGATGGSGGAGGGVAGANGTNGAGGNPGAAGAGGSASAGGAGGINPAGAGNDGITGSSGTGGNGGQGNGGGAAGGGGAGGGYFGGGGASGGGGTFGGGGGGGGGAGGGSAFVASSIINGSTTTGQLLNNGNGQITISWTAVQLPTGALGGLLLTGLVALAFVGYQLSGRWARRQTAIS